MRSIAKIVGIVLLATVAFAQHSATLTWAQSVVTGQQVITSNNVYKSTTPGGPYTNIFSSATPITSFQDTNVLGNGIYYYVVDAVCSSCNPTNSPFSNEAKAVIPPNAQPAPVGGLTVVTR